MYIWPETVGSFTGLPHCLWKFFLRICMRKLWDRDFCANFYCEMSHFLFSPVRISDYTVNYLTGVWVHVYRFFLNPCRLWVVEWAMGRGHIQPPESTSAQWVAPFHSSISFPRPHVSIPVNSDFENLEPMYARLHSAIREYDDQHIIFFEPTVAITSVRIHTVHSECLYLVCVCVCVCSCRSNSRRLD